MLRKIGEGGCGVVYLAEQQEPVRWRVALKIIKLGMDTRSVVARFEAQRQAPALMDHPDIAKGLDGGATPTGRLYFVMELVRGVRIIRDEDPRRSPVRLNTLGIAEALTRAAEQVRRSRAALSGIAHRPPRRRADR